MKSVKTFIICFVLFIAERVLFTHISVFSMTPWLLLAFWIDMALMSDEDEYIPLYAGICGLLCDISGGGYIGVNMAVFALISLLVNYVSGILRSGFFIGISVCFFAFITAHILCVLLSGVSISAAFVSLILPQAIINTVFAAILYPLVKRMYFYRRILI